MMKRGDYDYRRKIRRGMASDSVRTHRATSPSTFSTSQSIFISELLEYERILNTERRTANKGGQCGLAVDYTVKMTTFDC